MNDRIEALKARCLECANAILAMGEEGTTKDALSVFSTIILETKKKRFRNKKDALRYITIGEKRNITREYRRLYPAGEGDPLHLDYEVRIGDENRITLDVLELFSSRVLQRYEYLAVENNLLL